jgi:shikimate kinase
MRLWLIGMMGSGKTTAGTLAAAHLEVPFHDTDDFVAQRMGCSVVQMWGNLGEAAFREMEKVAVVDLGGKDGVIATGGGVILDEDNRGVLSDDAPVVWLEASLACLQLRLEPTLDRPGLVSADISTEEFLAATLENRRSLYARIANHHIDTDSMSIEEVAAKIEDIWRS